MQTPASTPPTKSRPSYRGVSSLSSEFQMRAREVKPRKGATVVEPKATKPVKPVETPKLQDHRRKLSEEDE